MPVERFRSVEDIPRDPDRIEDPREALRRMGALTRFARSPNDPAFAPGVHKYRSLDEAQEARASVEEARVRARAGEGRPACRGDRPSPGHGGATGPSGEG